MKQYHIDNKVFNDLITDEEGEVSTSGQGWVRLDSQDDINAVSQAITAGGEVWLDATGSLKTSPPRPSPAHKWDSQSKAWLLDNAAAAALKTQQQEEVWARIKAKREAQRYGGAYIPTLKKWLQTDEPSRTQYLQLQLLEAKGLFKQPVRWKTMDNSFIALDAAAVTAIAMQIMDNEQVDFANAERHRAAMLKADNPLDYDYSGGWTEIYQAA